MEITVTASTLEDADRVRQFFFDLEDELADDTSDDEHTGYWIFENYPRIKHDWARLIFAYETVYQNACDQTVRHLEWKPEIKAALAAISQVSKLREAIDKALVLLVDEEIEDAPSCVKARETLVEAVGLED